MTYESNDDKTQALYQTNDIYSDVVYLIDKNPVGLVKQYHAIKADKQIISVYGLNGRHCMVLFVNGKVKVKKIIKKGLLNGSTK